jgi:hypothetical protein
MYSRFQANPEFPSNSYITSHQENPNRILQSLSRSFPIPTLTNSVLITPNPKIRIIPLPRIRPARARRVRKIIQLRLVDTVGSTIARDGVRLLEPDVVELGKRHRVAVAAGKVLDDPVGVDAFQRGAGGEDDLDGVGVLGVVYHGAGGWVSVWIGVGACGGVKPHRRWLTCCQKWHYSRRRISRSSHRWQLCEGVVNLCSENGM